ncbi:MAG: sodium:proton antiporter [Sulfurovum sp.]|nr:MAG: sodium:proton antiporter [Sulfurovum sp.]
MQIYESITILIVLLLVAILSAPLAKRLGLPFSALLVIEGFVGSELIVALGFDLGLRWYHFHDLVFFILLPVLIFESALNIDVRLLLKNLIPIFILAIPIMLLSTGITAVLLYYGIDHPLGFPVVAALLTGAILSATDPVAVLDVFKHIKAPQRLSTLVDGESLFNDATVIVLFGLFIAFAQMDAGSFSGIDALKEFISVFFGGIVVGAVLGLLFMFLYRVSKGSFAKSLISILSAYSAFVLAEHFLHVSGVMAVLVTGLCISWERCKHVEESNFVEKLWEFNAYLANMLIFLLVGITITVGMFTSHWLAMLIGIVSVLIARAIGIFVVLPLVSKLPYVDPISRGYQAIIFWGGLRGAVVVALALSIPIELEYWYTVQSIAYGVVLFTLFVQAPTIALIMKKVGVK